MSFQCSCLAPMLNHMLCTGRSYQVLNINVSLCLTYWLLFPCALSWAFLGSPSLFHVSIIVQLLFWNVVGASVVLISIQKYVIVLVKLLDIFNSCGLPGSLNWAFLIELIYNRSKLACHVGSTIWLACPCGIRLHLLSWCFRPSGIQEENYSDNSICFSWTSCWYYP